MRLQLHPDGPGFSSIAVGFWRMHEWNMSLKERINFIESCLEMGITTFDHADIYGSYGNEALFGEALKEKPGLRQKMELVSKCGICLTTQNRPEHTIQHYNTTAKHIRHSVENSLKNLHTDFLDLVLIHRPDPLMNAAEMAGVFMELINEGKIKHVGVSNFTPSQFSLFQSGLDAPLVTNQVECSLLHTDPIYDGTFDQAQKMHASPMVWSPFAGGKLFTSQQERAVRIRKTCEEIGAKTGSTIDQVALAWLLKLPCKPQPVLGTGKISRVKQAAGALNTHLSRQDWFKLLEASQGQPVP